MGWGPEDQERQDDIDDAIKNATEGLWSELSAMKQALEAAEAENAELTRKIGEQQDELSVKAYISSLLRDDRTEFEAFVYSKEIAALHIRDESSAWVAWQWCTRRMEGRIAELHKLLAEAKSKAVPEGWQLVPKEPTDAMYDAGWEHRDGYVEDVYKAMLSAAPQPGGSNE